MPTWSTTAHLLLGAQVDHDPERLQHIRRPAGRRRGPIAVLDDPGTRAGGNDRGHGRDVDRVRPVGAGADDVDGMLADLDRGGELEHRVSHRGQFLDRSPLARSATTYAPSWAGVASPARIWRIAQTASSRSRSRRPVSSVNTPGQVICSRPRTRPPARHGAAEPRPPAAGRDRSGARPRRPRGTMSPTKRRPGGPVISRIGGQRWTSSLSWRASPIPPGTASPSKIARSIPPPSMAVITAGWVATSSTRTSGRSAATLRPSAKRTFSRVDRSEAYSKIVSGDSAGVAVPVACLVTHRFSSPPARAGTAASAPDRSRARAPLARCVAAALSGLARSSSAPPDRARPTPPTSRGDHCTDLRRRRTPGSSAALGGGRPRGDEGSREDVESPREDEENPRGRGTCVGITPHPAARALRRPPRVPLRPRDPPSSTHRLVDLQVRVP